MRSFRFQRIMMCCTFFLVSSGCSSSGPADQFPVYCGFESFTGGVPEGWHLRDGAETGDVPVENEIGQDTIVAHSGVSSLRISGSAETTSWRTVSIDIPDGARSVTAVFFARGEDLGAQVNQFDNIHAGFWYRDLFSGGFASLVHITEGSTEWQEYTVSLDLENTFAENVRFSIFSSVSGTLWIDDVSFTYDEYSLSDDFVLAEPLQPYITELSRPTTAMELAPGSDQPCPNSITSEEALEDIAMLRYLFENGYSGFEYWEGQGVDFNHVFEGLEGMTEGRESISVQDLESLLAVGLSEIQDGHLEIVGHERHGFLNRMSPRLAEVIVERELLRNGGSDTFSRYTVVLSAVDHVQPGMTYIGPEDNLFPILSRAGVEQFQLGVFSDVPESEGAFLFSSVASDTVSEVLPLHEIRLSRDPQPGEAVFHRSQIDGIELVRIASFNTQNWEQLDEFAASGDDLSGSERLIVDLMGNCGGSSVYGRDFITGLNGIAQWRMCFGMLCSPATVGSLANIPLTDDMRPETSEMVGQMQEIYQRLKEDPVRAWLYADGELQDRQTGDYEGQAVFLVDRMVASSGEALVDYSRSVPGAVVIGENTAGIGTFGEVRSYWLPNSGICLRLPCKLFIVPGFQEGTGYMPDYWLDSPEPVEEVVRWMNEPDTYQFEFPPPPELHDIDFEEFVDGIPEHMSIRHGASSGAGQVQNEISQDFENAAGGSSSLRISGDINTHKWNSLFIDVPQDVKSVYVSYLVSGENIRQEGDQFNNCYLGFIYLDSSGSRQFLTNRYEGTFGWKPDSLHLDVEALNASEAQFTVFLSKTGTLWVDDLSFTAE